MSRPITIAGGGLAGLTLGILLRQQNVPVTVFEASDYPRHRVCGEFISGRGLHILEQLEVIPRCSTITARTVQLFCGERTLEMKLPQTAQCISRHELDLRLAERFRELGGDLITRTRFRETCGPGVVRATGRRSKTAEGKWRWFGLKVHGHNIPLSADLEMHFGPNAYVGLCRLAGDEVNICGLFRSRQAVPSIAEDWREIFAAASPRLRDRLSTAVYRPESFCVVAGVSLESRAPSAELAIGDSLGMIPPVTGNGMSIAFESAALCEPAISGYSRGATTWDAARVRAQSALRRGLSLRITAAGWMHPFLFTPALYRFMGFPGLASVAMRWVFSTTR